jgi:hypothetical protein
MPKRFLHLRHPQGFSSERMQEFRAGCRLFQIHVDTVLAEWRALPGRAEAVLGTYAFGEPSLSADTRVASLPLDGESTLGSRTEFESCSSYLLSQFLPAAFCEELESGLEEDLTGSGERITYWRRLSFPIERLTGLAQPFAARD